MIGFDNLSIKKKANQRGITILEALVSTAIIGIGFVAVFQMVQYSIRSIDVSSERTKMNYLVGMVAEDIISDKDTEDENKNIFLDKLIEKKKNAKDKTNSWELGCDTKPTQRQTYSKNVLELKIQKWKYRFADDRLKCRSAKDTKALKVFDICNNKVSGKSCNYQNQDTKSAIYEELYIGRMEAKINDGRKTKYLYFPIK
tara:strand:+ start:171 stop:770 length:600 start_codon:yes stop_codon:yes gene_type:complete